MHHRATAWSAHLVRTVSCNKYIVSEPRALRSLPVIEDRLCSGPRTGHRRRVTKNRSIRDSMARNAYRNKRLELHDWHKTQTVEKKQNHLWFCDMSLSDVHCNVYRDFYACFLTTVNVTDNVTPTCYVYLKTHDVRLPQTVHMEHILSRHC